MTGPKRVTEKQLAANRANALRSTGPRTGKGKARSRWNALRHGILSKALIPEALADHESASEFARLHGALVTDLCPTSPLESMLVETVAVAYWRLGRLLRSEAGAIAQALDRRRTHISATAKSDDRYDRDSALGNIHSWRRAIIEAGNDVNRLRKVVLEWNPSASDLPDERVAASIEQIQARVDADMAAERDGAMQRLAAAWSIPSLTELRVRCRYEAMLHGQITRALRTLAILRGGALLQSTSANAPGHDDTQPVDDAQAAQELSPPAPSGEGEDPHADATEAASQ